MLEAARIATIVAWVATAIGVGLWLWSWIIEKNPIRRLRLSDCGIVLVFSSILLRIFVQEKAMSLFDWAMAVLGPLFIALALWRLTRTGALPDPRSDR